MFDRILFPIDFSTPCVSVNRQVEWLANRFRSEVTLLHVFEVPASWRGSCNTYFVSFDGLDPLKQAAAENLKTYAIDVPETRMKRVLAVGDAAAEILDWAETTNADLIVMGTHSYGRLKGLILGSVSAKVLHSAGCPLWMDSLAHSPSDRGISKIVCAIEFIDEAMPLLLFTKALAEELGASVRLIHSVPELETRPNKYFDFDLHRYLTEAARVEIAKMQRAASTDFPVTVSGLGISDALAQASTDGMDLVIIGRGRAQNTFGRFQTHAYDIVRHAPCPVLSYSSIRKDHISSSCSAEHRGQSEESAQPLTGSPTS
ncbi:MAG: universal stress protein [Acidobacteriaceae bacterium]|nr:universal stress protein [Acidobacteriaceae bacterium]MBV8570934.1 universal stress protein [Acidobacteriaceae bacterium]